jgi:hypothetical protein
VTCPCRLLLLYLFSSRIITLPKVSSSFFPSFSFQFHRTKDNVISSKLGTGKQIGKICGGQSSGTHGQSVFCFGRNGKKCIYVCVYVCIDTHTHLLYLSAYLILSFIGCWLERLPGHLEFLIFSRHFSN